MTYYDKQAERLLGLIAIRETWRAYENFPAYNKASRQLVWFDTKYCKNLDARIKTLRKRVGVAL